MPELRHTTLASGLRIIADIDHRGYSAAIGYFVMAGARDETDCESGLSHFLEHMMFKGTDRRSAADVNRELDELGGQSNAYTSEEQTVFYASVLPKYQTRLIDLLTDMLTPKLDADEFATERQVILEEIAKYEDQPPFGAFERVMECCFGPRGLGRRVLGTPESIQAMTVESMRDYFHRRYRCENIVLAASGNVDFDDLVDQVSVATQSWSSRVLPPPPVPDDVRSLPSGITLDRQLRIPDASQAYRVTISDGPSMTSSDQYAVRLLTSILGDDGGSRLFWDLIDTGRAEAATIWSQEFIDAGSLMTYLVCAPEDLQSNAAWMNQVFAEVAAQGVDADELKQVIQRNVAACIMQSERPSGRLFELGSRWLCCNDVVDLDQLIQAYRAVDQDAIATVAQAYLRSDAIEVIASDAP